MAINRYYSAIAQDTTLSAPATNSATSITVSATTGFPTSYPYVLAVDYGASAEELVNVTAAAGLTLTVTRAFNGSSAVAHATGAVVRHVIVAQDMSELQAHINSQTLSTTGAYTSGVHGVAGSVVGTTDTQTLTNKTISGASNTITNVPVSTGISGLGTNVATFLATPTSANLASAVSDEIGSGPLAFANIVLNAQTGTSYTLLSSDVSKLVTLSNAAPITVTVPNGVFSTGVTINLQQIGAGQVTIANDGTTTITGTGTKLRTQYSAATLVCTSSNNFTLIGDIA